MSESRLISRLLIPLSASGVASKPLCPCMRDTLFGHNSDNLQASCYTNLSIYYFNSHFSLLCV